MVVTNALKAIYSIARLGSARTRGVKLTFAMIAVCLVLLAVIIVDWATTLIRKTRSATISLAKSINVQPVESIPRYANHVSKTTGSTQQTIDVSMEYAKWMAVLTARLTVHRNVTSAWKDLFTTHQVIRVKVPPAMLTDVKTVANQESSNAIDVNSATTLILLR